MGPEPAKVARLQNTTRSYASAVSNPTTKSKPVTSTHANIGSFIESFSNFKEEDLRLQIENVKKEREIEMRRHKAKMAELEKKEKEALRTLRNHSKLQSILAQLKDVQEDMETDGEEDEVPTEVPSAIEEVPTEVPSAIAGKLSVGDLGQPPGKAVMQKVHLGGTTLAHPGSANNDHLRDLVHDHSSGQVKVHSGGTLGTHSGGDPTAGQGDTLDDISQKLGSPKVGVHSHKGKTYITMSHTAYYILI